MTAKVQVEIHGATFEVSDVFTQPLVSAVDSRSGRLTSYRADPRADRSWTDALGTPVTDAIRCEDLDAALGAARETAGAHFFHAGEPYLLVLVRGEVLFGICLGPYAADAPSILFRTDDGELAVLLRTIRTAIPETGSHVVDTDEDANAVHVTFSCGHSGGVWAEDASPGVPKWCLVCRELVTVVGRSKGNVVPFPPRRSTSD